MKVRILEYDGVYKIQWRYWWMFWWWTFKEIPGPNGIKRDKFFDSIGNARSIAQSLKSDPEEKWKVVEYI